MTHVAAMAITQPLAVPEGRCPRRVEVSLRMEPTDASLVRAVADERDQRSLASLYDRHGALVYSLALRMLHSPETACEVAQDTFLTVWHRAAEYDPQRATVEGWIIRIARSRAIDRLRFERAAQRGSGCQDVPLDDVHVALAGGDDPADSAESGERRATVLAALRELPAEQYEPIVLAYFGGYTHSELAARLDVPLGTVKTRVLRGVTRLRHVLGGVVGVEEVIR